MIPKNAIALLDAIRATKKTLNALEKDFVASVTEQAKANKQLTSKQAAWLTRIYEKVTGGGQYEPRQRI